MSKQLVFKMEIELKKCGLTAQMVEDRIEFMVTENMPGASVFSDFIRFLARQAKATSWEMKTLEVKDAK